MRAALVVLACVALAATGCIAKANRDPYAYAKKPLYSGGFDLAKVAARGSDAQEFRVEDGSIGAIRVQAWVNATAGGARVDVIDPSGKTVLSTTQAAAQEFPLKLGVWRVVVTPTGDGATATAGHAAVLATRA